MRCLALPEPRLAPVVGSGGSASNPARAIARLVTSIATRRELLHLGGRDHCVDRRSTIRGTPGTLIFGPRGVPHSFEIHSDPVRMLILLTRPAWKATSRSSARRAGADSATAGGDSIRRHTKPDCRCVEVRDCECSAQALKGSVVARIAPLGRPGAPSSTVQFSGSGATEIVLDGSRVRYSG